MDDLYQAALEDGQLTWYSIAPSDYVERVARAFEAQFPGISVTTFSQTTAPLLETFRADAARGQVEADVLHSLGTAVMGLEEGLLEPFESQIAEVYPDEFKLFAPVGYPDRIMEHAVAFNIDSVTEEEQALLETWDGLLDPVFHRRISILDPHLNGGWANGFYLMWKVHGEEWLQGLAAQEPVMYSSNPPQLEALSSGQNHVSLTFANFVSDYYERGAPIEVRFPPPTTVYTGQISLVANSPNPAAGKLFLEWFLDVDGQVEWQDAYQSRSVHPDVPPRQHLAEAPWYVEPTDVVLLDEREQADEMDEFFAVWDAAFAGRGAP